MKAGRILKKIGLLRGRGSTRRKRRGRAAPAPASVGRYRLREEIGRGASGEVWRAVDPVIGRAVAVKILNVPEGVAGGQRVEWEQRFLREARATGMLSHPGIVAIHDVGLAEGGRPFIVMELVDGCSLDALIDEERAPREQTALEWGAQVASALEVAHRQGIVHRDVKPANVLIDSNGRARIADFGIARLSESDLTHEGRFLGSPAYASPEQLSGAPLDGRSDLFSLGSTLYQLLTGRRPFPGDDLSSLTYAICHADPAPMRRIRPGLSRACEAVVMRALAKDPRERYRSGQEMAETLRAAAEGRIQVTQAPAAPPPPAQDARRAPSAEPQERTMAQAGRGKARTRPSGAARERREPNSGGGRGRPQSRTVAAAALGLAVAAGCLGVWLLSRVVTEVSRRGESSRPDGAGAASLGGTPQTPRQAPWSESAGEDSAIVTVHVVHELPDGVLTIWSGRRRLLHAALDPASGEGESSGGDAWPIRLPAGDHPLRIKISSPGRRLDLVEEVSRNVQQKRRYNLHVRVKDRPSPKLDLMWTDS